MLNTERRYPMEVYAVIALAFFIGLACGQLWVSTRYVEYHLHHISYVLCGKKGEAKCLSTLSRSGEASPGAMQGASLPKEK